MSKRQFDEYPWLEKSINSFNGSGYADRRSDELYMESYLAYKRMKNDDYGVQMAIKWWSAGRTAAAWLIEHSAGPSRAPNRHGVKKFIKAYPPAAEYLVLD